ncbi:MAG TPA: GLUG motif-containing protein, partial [Sedimentisphaerales bacterium]|nr:GLUG motif-containing protein [Sedimentisphaerales bacterium]
MANISKNLNISQPHALTGKLMMSLLIVSIVCIISHPAKAETSVYEFGPDQSIVIKTGGFAGVHETYSIAGQFQLSVDLGAGIASFEKVDANLADETGLEYGRSLEEIFNMTGLAGTIIDDKTIEFEGKTADGTESDVRLKLSFSKGPAHLTGQTTPPLNSADMFFYDVNAVATKKYAGGTGEPNDPYEIATAEDLIALGETPEDYDKHFILIADIDLDPNLPGRKVFDKAVIAPDTNDTKDYFEGVSFTGTFDGKSHVIGNLHIQGGDYMGYLGLFGKLDSGAMVSNLGLEAVDVNGTGDYVGGLVGQNDGSIATSYSTGTVDGHSYFSDEVGGLVGLNYGSISMSYSTGMVTGRWNVGGLAGSNSGNITKSYTMGTVSGDFQIGGLVGANGVGTVT